MRNHMKAIVNKYISFFEVYLEYSTIHGLEPVRIHAISQMQTPLNEKWMPQKQKGKSIYMGASIPGIYLHDQCTALAVVEQLLIVQTIGTSLVASI